MADQVEGSKKPLHIAMFPWLAFGHIIPFLDLSKLIVQKGHRISFLSTPRNIDRLPTLPPSLASSITFVKLPLPKLPGLPDDAEATMDIQGPTQMALLKKAFDGLEPGLTRFVNDSEPDWIIHDFAQHWLPAAVSGRPISLAYFSIINAWFIAFLGLPEELINGTDSRTTLDDFMVPPKWVGFETTVAYRRFEAKWALRSHQVDESGFSDGYRLGCVASGCDAVFFRHCHEFEPDWLSLLADLYGKPIVPVGLMPPPPPVSDNGDNQLWESIQSWLDGQKKGSVVYVALGSEVTPNQDQLSELAYGLELSKVPFFWVLRKPAGSTQSDSFELPAGFEDRVRGVGMVWRKWAPQLKILSHDSIGGFLTHCGWGSIIEGLMFGRPLITLPFLVDQGLNSRIIDAKNLGIEIPRDEEGGSYTRNAVANSVKQLMVEDEKKKFKENAKKMSIIFSDVELHEKYIARFVEFLEADDTGRSRKLVSC